MLLLKDRKSQFAVFMATFAIVVQANFIGKLTSLIGMTYTLGALISAVYLGMMYIFLMSPNEPKIMELHCSTYFFGFKKRQIFISTAISLLAMFTAHHWLDLDASFGVMFLTNIIVNLVTTGYYARIIRNIKKKHLGK